jgi:hypothetical protein
MIAELPGNKYQAIGWVFPENVKEKLDWIMDKYNKYRVKHLYNEENPDKGYTADALKEKGARTKTYHESTNKHIKIINYLKGSWPDIIWCQDGSDENNEYMEQILDYEEGQEPDDAPDSAASLIREAFRAGNADMGLWDM